MHRKKQNIIKKEENREDCGLETAGFLSDEFLIVHRKNRILQRKTRKIKRIVD